MLAGLSWLLIVVAFTSTATIAAPQFPPLTGRVVDEAGILSQSFESEIGAQLAAHERATANQVVVVTLGTLQGYDISDYGYQLGRHWGIGQQGKNNGVLLIVAPNERKLRIEVGYGLEGVLTDAISRDIIERRIKPPFRRQNYEQGVRDGVDAILAALGGEYQTAPPPVTVAEKPDWLMLLPLVFFVVIPATKLLMRRGGRRHPTAARAVTSGVLGTFFGLVFGFIVGSLLVGLVVGIVVFVIALLVRGTGGRGGWGGGDWGSGGSWGGGDGGFSGGGGSFGGGGASGDW